MVGSTCLPISSLKASLAGVCATATPLALESQNMEDIVVKWTCASALKIHFALDWSQNVIRWMLGPPHIRHPDIQQACMRTEKACSSSDILTQSESSVTSPNREMYILKAAATYT